jgi:protein-S-isoprenylcysteine O-methyltransferase Ste14
MEDQKDTQPQSLIDQIKEYIELQIKIAKLKAIDGSSGVIASAIVGTALALLALFLILFASMALGFYLSDVLESFWAGFGCVAGLYLILVLILLASSKAIKASIADKMINKIIND